MTNPLMKKSIIIAIILLIFFSILASLYTNSLSDNLYSETNSYLNEIALQTATAVNNKVNESLTQLDTVGLIIQRDDMKTDQLFSYLNQLAHKNEDMKRFGIADKAGNVKTSDLQTFNIKDRDYFQKSLQGQKVNSNTITDILDGELINVFSIPLYNQSKDIEGVLFATFHTAKLSAILDNASFDNTGYSFIFNEQGNILLSSKQANQIQDTKNIESLCMNDKIKIENMDIHGNGIINFIDQDQTQNYFIYSHVADNDWIVGSIFPKEVVTKQIQQFVHTAFITWFLIGTGSACLISYIYFIQRKSKLKIAQLAFEDPLTHRSNYNQFTERCKKISHLSHFILINCDIKAFKWFNEIYGEEIANDLLIAIAQCIDEMCGEDELFCREKDDRFAILLNNQIQTDITDRLYLLANNIRLEFMKKHSTSQFYFHFGIYDIPKDEIDIKSAFQKTQYVQNDHKQLSQDDIDFYQENLFQESLHQLQIEQEFRSSLEENRFLVYIQPKVNLQTGDVISGEALVRWLHPTHGLISPNSFIPIFEKNGMLESLDTFVFIKILKALENWNQVYNQKIYISINVSRTYLFNQGFIDEFIKCVETYDIDPHQIEVEITETTALNHQHELIKILNKLKKHNIRISLDDFGSGYSSLNMLKDYPIDVVKIDQEFFRTNLYTHLRSHIIIEEVIALCHKLNITVVAEGVENKEQQDFLIEHQCDYVQGYYHYKPMPIHEFEELFIKEVGH